MWWRVELAGFVFLRMDFSRTLVKPAAFCLQPSHQRSLPSHSSLSGMEELRTCRSGCIYSVDPGISLASVFCYELMVEWMKKKTSGYAWPWKATLFSYVFPSYVWMISLPAHLYLSPVTLPGSVLSFLHGAIVCPYMHAHTQSHPADFTVLRVELALRNQSFTVLKGSTLAGERLWCSQPAHFHLCQQTALSGPAQPVGSPEMWWDLPINRVSMKCVIQSWHFGEWKNMPWIKALGPFKAKWNLQSPLQWGTRALTVSSSPHHQHPTPLPIVVSAC